MHRVHFTSHDIRNARVGASYGPLAETAFSFDHLYRRAQGLRFDGWRSRVRPASISMAARRRPLGAPRGGTGPLRR